MPCSWSMALRYSLISGYGTETVMVLEVTPAATTFKLYVPFGTPGGTSNFVDITVPGLML